MESNSELAEQIVDLLVPKVVVELVQARMSERVI